MRLVRVGAVRAADERVEALARWVGEVAPDAVVLVGAAQNGQFSDTIAFTVDASRLIAAFGSSHLNPWRQELRVLPLTATASLSIREHGRSEEVGLWLSPRAGSTSLRLPMALTASQAEAIRSGTLPEVG